jgi:nitroreductase
MSFLTQLSWRYATKKFDTTKKVSQEQLAKIMEAIKMAPSAFGLQPYHVVIISNKELREKIGSQKQQSEASHLLVFCIRTDLIPRVTAYFDLASGNNEEVRTKMKDYEDMVAGFASSMSEEQIKAWAAKQAYIALGFGLAAAAELEVDAGPMEGFDPIKFKEELNLPEYITPVALMALGFRAEGEVTPPKVRFNDLFENRD